MIPERVPYSADDFDDAVRDFLRETVPQSVMDIGPGAGKYGQMVRDLKAQGVPLGRSEAIEIDQVYIDHFGLRSIYDFLELGDATTLPDRAPDAKWDVVILGDVLEHFRKSRGVDLLDYLYYRTKFILLIIPIDFVQGAWEGHTAEAHISTWAPEDFTRYKATVRHADRAEGGPEIMLVTIRGLLDR